MLLRIPLHLCLLIAGIFVPEKGIKFYYALWQIISRLTWELPQVIIGMLVSFVVILVGKTAAIDFIFGSTVIRFKGRFGGFTLGHIMVGDSTIKPDPNNGLFQHEFGHVLQSRKCGLIYLTKFALPSLISSWRNKPEQHDRHPVEQDANQRSKTFFTSRHGLEQSWNEKYNPVFQEIIPDRLIWWDFLPVYFPLVHLFKAFRK